MWVDETRPLLQGARLTMWECDRLGIDATLIADGAAASLMAAGDVDLVIVGADRIAANGDVANKIGTYGLAVAARHHQIPFYVAAPASTIDLATATGADDRDRGARSRRGDARRRARASRRPGSTAFNPAFDVTPARLVTAIVTEVRRRAPAVPPLAARARPRAAAGGWHWRDAIGVRGTSSHLRP